MTDHRLTTPREINAAIRRSHHGTTTVWGMEAGRAGSTARHRLKSAGTHDGQLVGRDAATNDLFPMTYAIEARATAYTVEGRTLCQDGMPLVQINYLTEKGTGLRSMEPDATDALIQRIAAALNTAPELYEILRRMEAVFHTPNPEPIVAFAMIEQARGMLDRANAFADPTVTP